MKDATDIYNEKNKGKVRSSSKRGDMRWGGAAAMTLTVGLILAFADSNLLEGEFTTYGTQCAGYVLYAAPVIIFSIALQKWFIRGLTEGQKL
jgi:ABC-type glycerol-3-phosphate transport system permease component